LLILVITFIATYISYNNKLKSSGESFIALNTIQENLANEIANSTEASSDIGRSIDEAINVMENETGNVAVENEVKTENQAKATSSANVTNESKPKETKPEPPKDPEFAEPVKGEIMKEFAKDTLVFSETLQEWTPHLGIDIKAERTTVVKASEAGTVIAIKNDPRYGLTVVIEHVNGFKSIYSNLLTSEFVSEGDKVKKEQTIGTVGNSASFEIVDPPHLHFEILKNDENVDPSIYIK
jgi:murein DD-endopeptidase MepM/ murein hydrolase activator NlpD